MVPFGLHFSDSGERYADKHRGAKSMHYATFHSPWGDAVGNTIILGLLVGLSVLGVRRELFQRI